MIEPVSNLNIQATDGESVSLDEIVSYIKEQFPNMSDETVNLLAKGFYDRIKKENLTFENKSQIMEALKDFLKDLADFINKMICQGFINAFGMHPMNPDAMSRVIQEILSAASDFNSGL